MSKRNRLRREQNRLRKEQGVNVSVDCAKLAEAVHRSVCFYAGNDGSGECLTYAITACAWLNRNSHVPHAVAGGYFISSVKDVGEVHFEHFWIMRGGIGNWTYLDFATRHNVVLIQRGIAKAQPQTVLADDAISPGLDMPFYVGNGEGLPWQYQVLAESSRHAQSEYEISNTIECAARVARYMR